MNPPTASAHGLHRRLRPVVGLLLLALLVVGGLHHHADGGHHPCAVCTVVHTPAVTSTVTPAATPPEGSRRSVQALTQCAPGSARHAPASSRAPPLA